MVLVEPQQVGDSSQEITAHLHMQTQGMFVVVGPCLGVFSEMDSGRRVWNS